MSSPNGQPKKSIRARWHERGWAQIDLAVQVGVNVTMVARWERGLAMPRRGRQQALADLFGVGIDAITFGQVEEQS